MGMPNGEERHLDVLEDATRRERVQIAKNKLVLVIPTIKMMISYDISTSYK